MSRQLSFYFNTGLLYSAKGYTYEDKSKQVDEIGKGKQHVLKEIMELADKMQVLCQYRIKTLIPIRRRAIHSNECIKSIVLISWKREGQH